VTEFGDDVVGNLKAVATEAVAGNGVVGNSPVTESIAGNGVVGDTPATELVAGNGVVGD
jgi:hypothetical protein